MHIQIRLMGNFGLNEGVPWHVGTNRSLCLFCKECNSFSACMIVLSLKKTLILYGTRITETNPLDGSQIFNFIGNLDGVRKVLLLLGALSLPFDNATAGNSYQKIYFISSRKSL